MTEEPLLLKPPLILADGIGKRFSRALEHQHHVLGAELWSLFWSGRTRETPPESAESFWALQGLTFGVARGEVLGVIGHNGAGKTTLLRVLNGEMSADAGTLEIVGQRSSLIDLTGGFSSIMTGRENIYYRGAHLGFDRAFLRAKEAEIIAFAELDEFIDSPIKGYSSGMLMRLGFAVTVFAEPDVLLVDEILSVGDFLFAQKCMNKINQLRENSAVVIVSHSMETITQFADRALLLDRGEPVFMGRPIEAVEAYYELEKAKQKLGARLSRDAVRFDMITIGAASEQNFDWSLFGEPPPEGPAAPPTSEFDFSMFGEKKTATIVAAERVEQAPPAPLREGLDHLGAFSPDALPVIARASMHEFLRNDEAIGEVVTHWIDTEGKRVEGYCGGDPAALRISFLARRPIRRLVVGVPVWAADGVFVTAFGTHGRHILEHLAPGRHRIDLRIPALPLNRGEFFPVVAIQDGTEFIYRWPIQPLKMEMSPATLSWGVVTVDYDWEAAPAEAVAGAVNT